jgi:hypothetical protein
VPAADPGGLVSHSGIQSYVLKTRNAGTATRATAGPAARAALMRVVAPVAVMAMVTVVTVVVTEAAVRVLVTVAVGRRLARVLLVRGARLLLVRVARLGLNRLGLAVVVMVMVVEVLPRKIQLDAAERLPFRQELAELGVQFEQAKTRH